VNDCYGIDTHNNDSDPMDDNNHGTHVAGTIGAKSNNGIGVAGINWDIKLMACKFVSSSGSGTIAAAIECMEYIKMMKDRGHNIVATNNSWGGGGYSQAMYDAIEAHLQRGILFIAAAGNGDPFFGFPINNDQSPFYPCGYYLPNVICVASTTRTDARSSFSNYGRRTVHLGAPGSEILSTIRNNNYGTSSGTSMATPHVTGVAALLKAQDPSRDWRAIKNLILAGGDTISSMANTVTHKRLNANGALTCSNSPVFSRLRPIGNTINGAVGEPIDLSALNINCASPNGNVTVSINSGSETITLVDNGAGPDQAAGDGIYSARWTPAIEGVYTLTFPGGDVVTVGVGDPKLNVSPSTIAAGSAVTASWSGIAGPTAQDWIGLYQPGAANSPSIAWRYTTGTASGEVPFTIPSTVAPGTYELRLFANNGYTLLAVSEPLTVTESAAASLSVSPSTITSGGTATASWSEIASPTAKDWIGLYQPGSSDKAYLAWRFTTGTATGDVPFTIPTSVAAGAYELRLFANNGYTRLAVSNALTVTAPPQASLSVSPTTITAGGMVTATWSGIAFPTAKDWIGLYQPGAANSPSITWRYTTGAASGDVPFTIPSSVAAGTYELRLFANDGYTLLAVSSAFTVTAPAPVTLTVSPTTIAAGGTVTAAWSGIAKPTAKDWIGLYKPGAGNRPSIAWRYTTGAASGDVPFTIPSSVAAGTYELRLFANDGYTLLAVSQALVVSSP
jgi:hypothetical protein